MRLIRDEINLFLLALQFLTRCPVPFTLSYSDEKMNASARYYPLVGIVVGCVGALVFCVSEAQFGAVLAALLSTAATVLFTGAFHEDGFADTCDGIGGQTRENTLSIMKDSRLGTYGAVGLGLLIAIKIIALSQLPNSDAGIALIVAHGLSRVSSVAVIATSQYVREEGTGKPTAAGLSVPSSVFVLIAGIGMVIFLGVQSSYIVAMYGLVGLLAGHVLMRLFYQRRLGGYTGDCLGAVQQLSEVGVYLGLLLSI